MSVIVKSLQSISGYGADQGGMDEWNPDQINVFTKAGGKSFGVISTGKGESFGKIKAMQPNLTQRMGGKAKKSKTSGED